MHHDIICYSAVTQEICQLPTQKDIKNIVEVEVA